MSTFYILSKVTSEKTIQIGWGFINRDASINVVDALKPEIKIQLRLPKELEAGLAKYTVYVIYDFKKGNDVSDFSDKDLMRGAFDGELLKAPDSKSSYWFAVGNGLTKEGGKIVFDLAGEYFELVKKEVVL